MKPTTPRRTRRLLARAATMNHNAEEFDDYGPEPNMKLSHAFLVVLLLHVIAVGGLYLFNSMKAERRSALTGEGGKTAASRAESGGGSSNGSPKGCSGKPPSEENTAPVAKPAENTQRNAASRAEESPVSSSAVSALSRARGILGKLTGVTAGSAATGKLTAQEAVSTPDPVPATPKPSAASLTVDEKTYIVKGGDTLTRIAATLGVTMPELEKANGLGANSVLQVGQVLKIPLVVPAQPSLPATNIMATPNASSAENAPQPEAATTSNYTVIKGDNPWKIAKKFKISQDELMKANGITDPKKIQIGQVLRIPPPSKGSKPRQ
jgi:LysM repeat protein